MNRSISLSSLFFPRPRLVHAICVRCVAAVLLAAWAWLGAIDVAWAQSTIGLRPFPPGVQRGALLVGQHPEVTVNGRPERLSPGARIYSADNRIVLSSALQGQKLLVNFAREPHGLVHEVWILTPAEAATPAP